MSAPGVFTLNLGPMLSLPAAPPAAAIPSAGAAAGPAPGDANIVPISSLPVPPPPPQSLTSSCDALAFCGLYEPLHAAGIYRKGNRKPQTALMRSYSLGDLPGQELQRLVADNGERVEGASMPEAGKLLCLNAEGQPRVFEAVGNFHVVRSTSHI